MTATERLRALLDEHKDEYTLDPIGDVTVHANRIIFEIPLGW